ncbi:pseudouridine synthase [Uliginosibacterium sp. H1]|uniref:pseudouridine synthase n=1 Tax=Uliginosibacterium sp. H1 TaxID=3114757 RepID=UPI002E19625A|nr:pseudouridine synthase [Uliginosibacterium sp. H1]
MLVLFNKPFNVLTQFSGDDPSRTLAGFGLPPHIYAAGRLDADSEGLLVLTDDGNLQHRLANPRHKEAKVYFAQVEGVPQDDALERLRAGLDLGDFTTRPCEASLVAEPDWLWPRDPPIRFRKTIPTSWLRIVLREGKNRQVRRMTAKVGLPTLRLVRESIGEWRLGALQPGQWCEVPGPAAAASAPRRFAR